MADDQSFESMLSPLAALRARLPDQPKLTPDEMRAASNFAAPTGPAPTLRPSTGPHRTLGERLGQNAQQAVQNSPTGAAALATLIQGLRASGPDVYGRNLGADLAGAVKRSNEEYEAQSQADPFYSAPGGMFDKTLAGGATLAGNLVGLGDPLFAAATPLTEGAAAANTGKKTLAQLAKEFAARSGKMGALNAGADTATQLAQLAGGTRDKYNPTETGEAFAIGPAFEVGKEALVGGAKGLAGLMRGMKEPGAPRMPSGAPERAPGAGAMPSGMDPIQSHVDRLTENWKSNTTAQVVPTEEHLPPEVAAQLKRDGMSGKTGALVGPDGKVYLIADQIGSPENATSALYHETLGHLGLNAKYGEQLDQALGRIHQSSPTVQREAEEWLRAHPEAYPDDPNKQMRAVEEVLAAKAEAGVLDVSIKSQLTAMIRQFGRMMGMNLEMSDKELAAILRSAQRKITHGQGAGDGAGANRYIFVGQKAYENLKKQDPRKLFPENQNLIANWEEGQRMMAQGFTPEQIFDKTGVFINPSDQMPRYELSDVPAVLNQDFRTWQLGQEAPLNQMLTHPTLMQAYPDKVKQWTIGRSDNPDYSGSFDANKDRIEITDKSQDPRSTALHEIQHGIQFHEGFDTGNNPESVLASATPEQVERYATELLPAFERKAQGAEIDAMIIREMKDDPRMIEYLQLNSMKAASLRSGVPLAQLGPLEAQIKASEGPALQAVYDATQDQSRANDEWRKISSTVLGNAIKRIETTPNDIFFGPLSKANIEAAKYQQVVDDIKSKDKFGMRDAIAWGDTVPEAASMRLRMYKNVSGEMESRDVEARKNLPEYALRTIRPLSTTNDTALVKPEDVIRTQRKGMSNPAIEGGLSDRDRELAGLMASVEDGNKHGFEPDLRVEVPNPPPPGTKAKFTQTTNNKNAPMADIRAKQGEYGAYEYGAEYGRDYEGIPHYRYKLPSGDFVEFSVPAYRRFMEDIKKPSNKVIPKNFKVTESGNALWYTRPEINQEKLETLARLYADREIRE
jgi:hypothetical protein